MFTIRKEHTFKRKIDVKVPVDNGFRSESFTATFRALNQDEAKALYEDAGEEKDLALLNEVFGGFESVKDEDGNDVEDTDETREVLMKTPYVALPLVKAYWEALSGVKTKN